MPLRLPWLDFKDGGTSISGSDSVSFAATWYYFRGRHVVGVVLVKHEICAAYLLLTAVILTFLTDSYYSSVNNYVCLSLETKKDLLPQLPACYTHSNS